MEYLNNFDYNNIDNGITYLQNNTLDFYLNDKENIIFHVYWYGKLSRKQICCIHSYLATQNLNNSELWVWLDYQTYNNSIHLVPKHKNIIVKKYIPDELAKNTLLEKHKVLNQTKFLKFRSDIARILFLHKYGGLYYDLDMILLKNIRPLLNKEFCYTWSTMKQGNNGILNIKKNSPLSNQLIKKYIQICNQKEFVVWYNQFIFTDEINILCLPCVLFDPVWILYDTKTTSKYSQLNHLDNFFKETGENIDNFFNNQIYTYHWHSRANAFIESNSYFEKIEKKHLNIINSNKDIQ